ncbi:hypothetical protein TRP8649_02194 [Pelagimonas phthalicica]|uniref:Uncharacterized protein n=1 Tax=Pelagimonas phthalicica TaxID=1037362 RepID=A0A238JBJ8_9RHOB|nr:hypothetical protein [Pelagimonas phthalicica]TDS91034.1 hypothetical protein CLV87_2196 [Pelagimonas phthalicica]SMX28081.1 hypothetical protein TRP8649_02194 [Pelagimonas phthalicica]
MTLALLPVLASAQTNPAAQNAPVAQSALPPKIESAPLDAPGPGAVGLLPSTRSGLPASLWRGSSPETLSNLVKAIDPPVPALRDLMRNLMLAEADPPADGQASVDHLVLRLDWLLENGAVDEALAMLDIVGADEPDLFTRWANLNLLVGDPAPVCRRLLSRPRLSADFSLRIFCTARSGDWNRAALILRSAETLGELDGRRAELLSRFLDPEFAEGGPALLPPVRPTPLEFRLFEALGEPLPTAPLPLQFSVLDLPGDNGWRAQIEAAERLARVGSLPPNRLLGLYSLRQPAASGGVWDRVSALQDFENALLRGRSDTVSETLLRVWPQMRSARLLDTFADLFGEALSAQDLSGRAQVLAQRAAFLSPKFEELAQQLPQDRPDVRFFTAIARGLAPDSNDLPDLPHVRAVAAGFAEDAQMPPALQEQSKAGRLGEVILRAIALFSSGAQGNSQDLSDALASLRALGLESSARQAALQLVILDAERARR